MVQTVARRCPDLLLLLLLLLLSLKLLQRSLTKLRQDCFAFLVFVLLLPTLFRFRRCWPSSVVLSLG
ncbi:hypothetical protein P3T76_002525 [Phytophthora citrophthora]|uniref:Uncharacterized protein n=1 Tax=Phytophthora citrophthora TaxID=4793 RepID=A0AAD9GVQ8_9STRA|nr:hypothetical protein P3T76_002525 [Phytophthora citrophthora]